MSYEVQIPSIKDAEITPIPATINQKFLLSVMVVEETITLEPYYYYSGEVYSGEVE